MQIQRDVFWLLGIFVWTGVEWACMFAVPDGKEGVIVIVICSGFILSWGFVARRVYKRAMRGRGSHG